MNRWLFVSGAALVALSLALIGCGSGGNRPYAPGAFDGTVATPTPTPTPTPGGLSDTFPDFNITPPDFGSGTLTLAADGTLTANLVVRTNASVGAPIALSLRNPAAGVSATFSPASVTPSSNPIPVTMQLRVPNASQGGSVRIYGKSGTIERTASLSYSAFVAPSGFSIAIVPVAGQSNSSRTRQFDVTLSQTSGSGQFSLSIDSSNLSGDAGGIIPSRLPLGSDITGLPSTATLSGSSQTFRVTATLAADANPFYYGFGVRATREGRTETAAVAFLYDTSSSFTLAQQVSVSGNTDTIKLTFTPQNPAYEGTVVVDRTPDGNLVDGSGQTLATLPAGTVVSGLPQTLTFDGTGQSQVATFTVTAPAGTPNNIYYGIRVKGTAIGSEVETVLLLQFGIAP